MDREPVLRKTRDSVIFVSPCFILGGDEQAKRTCIVREIACDAGIGRWPGAGVECRLGKFAILGRIAIGAATCSGRPVGA
jgi:hypothetical protein